MSAFWKVLVMGATAAAAVVVAKEVVERNERGEDCSPVAVLKGIGRKIGVMCGCKDCSNDECCDDFFDDFDEFELDDDDLAVEFDTSDMDGDELTADGYVVEFNAETDPEVVDTPEEKTDAAAPAEQKTDASTESEPANEEKTEDKKDKK